MSWFPAPGRPDPPSSASALPNRRFPGRLRGQPPPGSSPHAPGRSPVTGSPTPPSRSRTDGTRSVTPQHHRAGALLPSKPVPLLRSLRPRYQDLPPATKRPGSQGTGILVSSTSVPRTLKTPPILLPATLAWGKESHSIGAYLDSGADDSFLNLGFARQVGVPLLPVRPHLQAVAIDGRPLAPIAHLTVPLTLPISGNHTRPSAFWCWTHPSLPWSSAEPGWPNTTPTSAGVLPRYVGSRLLRECPPVHLLAI